MANAGAVAADCLVETVFVAGVAYPHMSLPAPAPPIEQRNAVLGARRYCGGGRARNLAGGSRAMRPRTAPRILLVDDEAALRQEVFNGLEARGYDVVCASSVHEAEMTLERGGVSIVVLDITMPGRDGWSFLPDLVNSWNLPVIVLTGNVDLKTRVRAFKEGAVDYLAKPFFIEELVARIRSRILSDTYSTTRATLRFGACEMDLEARTVLVGGAPVAFTEAEFDILSYFAARPDRAISRGVLAEKALSIDGERTDRTIDSHVSRIRTKLGAEGAHLKTAWGIGWKLATKVD